ncbi:MAG: GNAT family N-acetyltransferase [Acidimicrobiia bacterium]
MVLRRWRESDLAPFAALNADPAVMEHFPALLSREESDRMAERMDAAIDERGFGFWAVEVKGGPAFIGFVGLCVPRFDAPFMPAVEIGWRLATPHWGRGYATEAAGAAVGFGFADVGLAQIVSFTTPANTRSQRVMERLGMRRDPRDDFDHSNLPVGHPMRRMALYRLDAP